MPKWRDQDLNLVRGAAKQRQSEDRLRADAWRKEREAELEAVVKRSYDGSEHPQLVAIVEQFRKMAVPIQAEYDRVCTEVYPAEFFRPWLYWGVAAGGFRKSCAIKSGAGAASISVTVTPICSLTRRALRPKSSPTPASDRPTILRSSRCWKSSQCPAAGRQFCSRQGRRSGG
jgi:hypothetical protein